MWINGNPIYQSIFNLIYFTDETVNQVKTDNNIFRIFLDSTLQIIYLTYVNIIECGCLREEDVMMIPVQNAHVLKREKVGEELKNLEINLKTKIKSIENSEEKKLLSSILNRIKLRQDYLKIIEEQFDSKNMKRFDNLNAYASSAKDLLEEIKQNYNYFEENCKKTEVYFCEKLCRVAPSISSIKIIKNLSLLEGIKTFEQLFNNLSSLSKIYELTDIYQIIKSLETLNKEKPSFLIRGLAELNLFPKGSTKLFGQTEFASILSKNLSDIKVTINESSEFFNNIISVQKEMILRNLKNRTRQVRDSNALFEGLSILVYEGNHLEKENKNKGKKQVLTNFLLRQILNEMIGYIWVSFELGLYSGFELDYIFYISQTIIQQLCTNVNIIASTFGDKILREEDFAKSTAKKKLSNFQKMLMDEIHIFNGLRCALKGLTLMSRYLKLNGNVPSSKLEEEIIRAEQRFPVFKSTKYFIDFSYESFEKDLYFDIENEKEMIFNSADSYLKQAVKYLNELKSADIKLRDGFHYSNTYLDNLSKSIICNNLLLSKIKKLEKNKKMRLTYVTNKYDTFLPILELN